MFSTNKWKIVSSASGKRRPRRFTKAGSDTRVFVQPKCSISSQVILLPFKDRIRVINFAKGSLTFLVKSLPGERANNHETALTERIALYRVSRIQIALLDIGEPPCNWWGATPFNYKGAFSPKRKSTHSFFLLSSVFEHSIHIFIQISLHGLRLLTLHVFVPSFLFASSFTMVRQSLYASLVREIFQSWAWWLQFIWWFWLICFK